MDCGHVDGRVNHTCLGFVASVVTVVLTVGLMFGTAGSAAAQTPRPDVVPVHFLGVEMGPDGEARVVCREHPMETEMLSSIDALNAAARGLFKPVPAASTYEWHRDEYFVGPGAVSGKAAQPSATFQVEYNGFSSAAQSAFQYAVDIWSTRIESNVTIRIEASWNVLEENVLGSAGPTFFDDADTGETWYAIALGNAIRGTDGAPSDADIVANFNSDFDDWYFGLDGDPPPGTIDFVTVVLHEIGHGLGFLGSMKVDDGSAGAECTGTDGFGCWGFTQYPGIPVSYDRYAEDASGTSLIDTTIYPNPSIELGNQLEGSPVVFSGSAAVSAYGEAPPLYIPSEWDPGSSYSHLDELAFRNDPSALMTPSLSSGEALHDPGPVGCAVFADIGWTTTADCGTLTQPTTPAVPVLVSPSDGASGVSLPATFDWQPASRADTYTLQVSAEPEFASPDVSVSGLAESQYTVSDLAHETTYYWRVRSANEATSSEYSIVYSFSTAIAPADPPTLVSPEDGASDVPTDVALSWLGVDAATSFQVQLSTETSFASPAVDSTVTDTTLSVSGLAGETQYFWRVRSINEGGAGAWSESSTFATSVPLPPAPEIIQPESGAAGVDTSLVVEWTSVEGAASYDLQVARDSLFGELVVDTVGVAGTSLAVSGLELEATYYARVRSAADGVVSAWSTIVGFSTGMTVPLVPNALEPDDGARGVDVPTLFRWTDITGAEYYEFELAFDSTFSKFDPDVTGELVSDTNRVVVSGLAPATTYFWRVRAVNPAGRSVWTIGNEFETEADTSNVAVGDEEPLPSEFGLRDVYPNPFGGRATMTFSLPTSTFVTLDVYDVRGKRVAILLDERRRAGWHTIEWTPTGLSSGVYLVRLASEQGISTRKVMLVQTGR